jgi:hypothetical protein
MFIRKDREREVDEQDQSNGRVQEVREESGFEAADSGINDNYNRYKSASISQIIQRDTARRPTPSRNQNPSRRNMHARHARHKLRASKNHASAAENVVDQVEQHKDTVCICAVPDPDELERSVRIWNAKLRHNT